MVRMSKNSKKKCKVEDFLEYFNNVEEDLEFLEQFWGIKATTQDIKKVNEFKKIMKLRAEKFSPTEISQKVDTPKGTFKKWIYGSSRPGIIRLLEDYIRLGTPEDGKWLSVNSSRGGIYTGPWIKVPKEIEDYEDVLYVINQLSVLQETYNLADYFDLDRKFLEEKKQLLFAYFLGVFVGDASKKEIKRKRRISRRANLTLSKRYQSNKRLGKFFKLCLNSFGLKIERIKDMPAGRENPHPFFRWSSQSSILIQWIYKVCLGLQERELTTYDPIKADWILDSSKEFKIWFIQGLGDSDGFIDLSCVQAGILTGPNTELVEKIFNTLNVNTTKKYFQSSDIWSLMLKIKDAHSLPVFNPFVRSYRFKLLNKVKNADIIRKHWPEWLLKKIDRHLENGLLGTEVVRRILDEEKILIRAQNVNDRVRKGKVEA